MSTTNIQLPVNQFPLKRTWELVNICFTMKAKRTTLTGVGEAERRSCQNVTPGVIHTVGRDLTRWVLLLDDWRVGTPHQAPMSPGIYTRRTSPQSIWHRKPMGLISKHPKVPLQGLPAVSVILRRHKIAEVWKVQRLFAKESHFWS